MDRRHLGDTSWRVLFLVLKVAPAALLKDQGNDTIRREVSADLERMLAIQLGLAARPKRRIKVHDVSGFLKHW